MLNSFKSLIISILLLSNITYSKDMEKIVFSEWDKPKINIFYNLPAQITENTKVLFIIHGNSRNADGYLKVWMKLARKHNVLLIAPEFNRSNFPSYNTLMMSTSDGRIRENKDLYLHNSIDLFFDYFNNKFDLNPHKYMIYGHSGGSQFVHRYLLMSDNPKVDKAVAANAGWYTFLHGAPFPYGIKNPPIELTSAHIRRFLSTEIHILIGSKDVDVDSSVNQSDGANAQGSNRFQRARNFFDVTTNIVETNDLDFEWKYQIVNGAAHSNSKMSKAAAKIILKGLEEW